MEWRQRSATWVFPGYFRVELAIAKFLGALALLLPFAPKGFKQFAYAGFTISLVSAVIAHASSGNPAQAIVTPAVFLVVLIVSFLYYNKLQ
ncbi:DoxX family protein [Niabella ginsenosidivorans]|uniref:DoxX family protein n=1 Tax=Niabella ginsenosidivorans TaxID=1176587 RepID=UPI00373FDFDC